MPTNNITILGDINKQLLGLTDQHIHYLANECLTKKNPPNKSLANDNARKPIQALSKSTIGIHQQMNAAFKALRHSAKTAGIDLKIASGFRSFERQLQIWNSKFSGKATIKKANGEIVDISRLSDWEIIEAILLYSALPGASRHHWGCDIDVYAPNLLANGESLQLEPWEYQQSGPMAALSSWLTQHAAEFGFYLPYDCYRGGIAAEPWHLSFAPLATQYQATFKLQALQACLINTDIAGKMVIIDNLTEIAKRYINNVNTRLSI
ncbi:MAG TPA: D-alanyl-D-alanine carboxypeptidase [Colwellia sp.]|nr:D-alanyl-D-alanine carboxypeptidase [Colwellia sp.]